MDFNYLLLSGLLIRGRFDGIKINESKFRVYMSYVLVILQIFCGLKMLVVVLMPWDDKAPILFYLVELYIFPGAVQNVLFVGVAGIHLHLAFIYWKWGQLSADAKRMHYLKMLFMPNINGLCRYYKLPLDKTTNFVQRVEFYEKMTFFFIVVFELFFFLLLGRCLYSGYLTLPASHFFSISVPMAIITFFCYHWLTYGFLVSYLLALVAISFLDLRFNTVSKRICLKFRKNVGRSRNMIKPLTKEDEKKLNDIVSTIEDIVKQFKDVNLIFDRMISPTFVNCLVAAFIYPSFLFLDFSFFFKVISIILYAFTIGVNCLIIVIFNEGFIRSVSIAQKRLKWVKSIPKILTKILNNCSCLGEETRGIHKPCPSVIQRGPYKDKIGKLPVTEQ